MFQAPAATEAVVVLANLMDPDGKLNTESEGRLQLAIEHWKASPGALLVTTGWNYRPDSAIKIAHAFRDTAVREYSIPKSSIIADTSARDTVGDAVFVKRNVIDQSAIRTLTVVSSDYHMERVQEIFEFVFGGQYRLSFAGAPTPAVDDIELSERRSIEAFRRTFAGVVAGNTDEIYRRLIEAHPFYNGAIHPAVT